MMWRRLLVLALVAGHLAVPASSGSMSAAASDEPPGPRDPAAARKAGRDAGPAPHRGASVADAGTAAAGATFRVFATQYHPNTKGSVEVAIPDKCAKFASLGWTSALSSANCPSGYRTDLDWRVKIERDSGQRARIKVKDVGPWNTDDNYWNGSSGPRPRRRFTDLPRGKPEAEAAYYDGYNTVPNCKTLSGSPSGRAGAADQFGRCVLNPAGIDLSVAAAAKLGLGSLQNEWVTVTFLWERAPKEPSSPKSHVLWHHTEKGKVKRWVMSGTTKERSSRIALPKGMRYPSKRWLPVGMGDFNKDGHSDLLWWKQDTDALLVWFMKGSTYLGRSRVDDRGATMDGWVPVGVADLDRNGRPDIVWHNPDNGKLEVWHMRRTKRKTSVTIDRAGEAWPSSEWAPFASEDFDEDGKPDVAWHDSTTGRVMIWYLSGSDGTTRTATRVVDRAGVTDWPNPAKWVPVGAGHYRGTGVPDILWHNMDGGTLAVWKMGGSHGEEVGEAVAVEANRFPDPVQVPAAWR